MRRSRVPIYLGLLACASVAFLQPYRLGIVMGRSMTPSLEPGHAYLMRRVDPGRDLHRGDVVVFRRGAENYVKRILAMPGDSVYLLSAAPERGADQLLMTWQLGKARRLRHNRVAGRSYRVLELRLPPGFCYAVGDHLGESVDSRDLGMIPFHDIQGRLVGAPPPSAEVRGAAVAEGRLIRTAPAGQAPG